MRQIRKILIIDNEPAAFETQEIIRRSGTAGTVDIAVTAREAIRYIEQREFLFPEQLPDLVFLEVNLSQEEGIKFLESFNNLNEELRDKIHLIVLTSDDKSRSAVQATSDPDVEELIQKPITVEKLTELRDKIAEWIKK